MKESQYKMSYFVDALDHRNKYWLTNYIISKFDLEKINFQASESLQINFTQYLCIL